MCICIAHRRKTPIMSYCFPYVSVDLRKPAIQPGISEHCETTDTGWCIAQYACSLAQLLPGTHSSLTTEDGLTLSRPGCLVLRRSGLPVKKWSPTQALTTMAHMITHMAQRLSSISNTFKHAAEFVCSYHKTYLSLLLNCVTWQVEMEHFAAKTEDILKENERLHIRIEQVQAVGPVGMTEWWVVHQCWTVYLVNSVTQYIDKPNHMGATAIFHEFKENYKLCIYLVE